ncbi:MAG: hypothetical protein JXC31_05885 [Acholeplasmataceae bacterium]|nr:hypothetical protein [Acholeplasmataceae bacterium]
MKHILLFFGFTTTLVAMTLIIINQEEKPLSQVLSVQKYYSYLYDETSTIEIPLYTNDANHPLTDLMSYSEVSLCNNDETKKLELTIESIDIGYDSSYLNQNYTELMLHLEMPELGEDFWIDDLWITITLINDDHYKIKLGSLSLMINETSTENLEWVALEGHKNESVFIPRLATIMIDYDNLSYAIEEIMIGKDYTVNFLIEQDRLILSIPYEEQLMNEVPIIIYYENGLIQNILNFKYMMTYDTLSESGLIIESYALN